MPKAHTRSATIAKMTQDSLRILKSLKSPPEAVAKVCQVLLTFLKQGPVGLSDSKWATFQRLLANPEAFLDRLDAWQPSHANPDNVIRAKNLLASSGVTDARLKAASAAASPLHEWLLAAMEDYAWYKAKKKWMGLGNLYQPPMTERAPKHKIKFFHNNSPGREHEEHDEDEDEAPVHTLPGASNNKYK